MYSKNTAQDLSFAGNITFEPLSKNNWSLFLDLFGEKGACGNCWCMSYRLAGSEFEEGKQNHVNRDKMKKLVAQNKPTGILGIYNGLAIAWCAFAPREDFIKLQRSRVHKRIDDLPVWSIPCFFIHKDFRRKGISVQMLKGVINYAKQQNIKIIEAYPVIPTQQKLPDAFAWIGLYRSFENAGFTIVDRTSINRPMVRYVVK